MNASISSRSKKSGVNHTSPSLVWLYVAKTVKVVGLATAQDLLRDYSFSVSGIIFWTHIIATILFLGLGRFSSWRSISTNHWPMLFFYSFVSWARLWFTLEATKYVNLIRIFMFTEYVGLWLPSLFTTSSIRGRNASLHTHHRTAAFALTGALFLELANDFGFTTTTTNSEFSPSIGWIFIGLTIGSILLQSRVRITLLSSTSSTTSSSSNSSHSTNSLDTLSLFTLSTPITTIMSTFPYILFGHSSTVLESHTITHVLLWMILLAITLLVVDALGHHSVGLQGASLSTVAVNGWRTVVGTASLLAALHRIPSLFDMAGIVLAYLAIYHLVKSDPRLLHSYVALDASTHSNSKSTSSVFRDDMRPRGYLHSVRLYWRIYLQPIWAARDSRSIFSFLCINLAYMFVQLLYGVWTNSLGLISDGIHMLFDCVALAVGLMAAVMAKWEPSPMFSFGYGRVETLSGFGNGIFLIFISIFILIEGIERIITPPEMSTDRLLLIAIIGFVVNMIGLFAFHDHHHHGHGHSHSHGNDSSCSGHHHHHHDANMQGVFLHILADALGSLGVIVSTLLIYQFGWTGFDPLASLLIGILIFASCIPLLKSALSVLLCSVPMSIAHKIPTIKDEIVHVLNNQVVTIDHRVWTNDGSDTLGLFRITLMKSPLEIGTSDAVLLDLVQQVLCKNGINTTTIEFQYDSHQHHISPSYFNTSSMVNAHTHVHELGSLTHSPHDVSTCHHVHNTHQPHSDQHQHQQQHQHQHYHSHATPTTKIVPQFNHSHTPDHNH